MEGHLHSNHLLPLSYYTVQTPPCNSANPADTLKRTQTLRDDQLKSNIHISTRKQTYSLKFHTHTFFKYISGQWEKEVEKEEEAPSVQGSWVLGSLRGPLSHPSIRPIHPSLPHPDQTPTSAPRVFSPLSSPIRNISILPSFLVRSGSMAGIHRCCLIQWPHDARLPAWLPHTHAHGHTDTYAHTRAACRLHCLL